MRRIGLIMLVLTSVVAGAVGTGTILWRMLPSRAAWPIVVLQNDGNLVLANLEGHTQPLTSAADRPGTVYLYPAPAPDGNSVASVEVAHGDTTATTSLVVHSLGGQRKVLFSEPGSIPFYLSWSPDSRRIAFLVGSAGGFTLHGVDVSDQPSARRITPGEPSYFAWSPDSQRLLLHTGGAAPNGKLQIYDWGAEQPQPLGLEPTLFQTPVWLQNGQQAVAGIRQNGTTSLSTIDASGAVVGQIAEVSPATVFVMSPDTRHLAYIAFAGPNAGQLHLVRADGTNDHQVGDEPVVTGFWSPTSELLAFISISGAGGTQPAALDQQQTARLRWNTLDLRDGSVRSFEPFEPSAEFLYLLPYFDQYAQSIRLWNRTGTQLLYATTDGVQMLDVYSGQTTRVGQGVLGLWLER
jgi:Tol biopolymer transport system component